MSILSTAKKCLFANLLLFASEEGDEATSPSFTTSYTSIQASNPSLETLISAWYVQWGWKSEHFTHSKQMLVCHFFKFLRAKRATRQRRPLLQQVTHRSKLPAHRWKRSFQLGTFSGDGKASTLPTPNKYIFANLLLFATGEGDEATSPSFTISSVSIQVSSPSLETLISAWYVQWEWTSEYFTNGKRMPICQSFTFCEWRGRRGNVALFYNKLSVNPSFQPIAGNAHFSLVRSVKMQMRIVYPWQTNTCLPIFYFL